MTGEAAESVVYVVDDDPNCCRLAEVILARAGLAVRCYQDPLEFLRLEDTARVACVLLDFAMPQMSGLEVLRLLRARDSGWAVVLLTGVADVPLAIEAMKLGACDFLQKPCPASKLVTAVQHALQLSRRLAQVGQERRRLDTQWARLSQREREVCRSLAMGLQTKAVARRLGLHAKTIDYHRTRAYRKLGVSNVVELTQLRTLWLGKPPADGSPGALDRADTRGPKTDWNGRGAPDR